MVYTWAADTRPLLEEEIYTEYFHQAPKWRQEKAQKIRFREDQALSIGAWILYERALREGGFSEKNRFNLSHSGHYVLCTIAESTSLQTGCDLEMIGIFRENVAKRFFCRQEWEYISMQETEEGKRDAFFRYWVLKESFMKATRLGMKLPLNAFEIALRKGRDPRLVKQPEEIKGDFFFCEFKTKEKGFHAAVCSEDREISRSLRWLSL